LRRSFRAQTALDLRRQIDLNSKRMHPRARPLSLRSSASSPGALVLAALACAQLACAHKPVAQAKFHYVRSAHPLAIGEDFQAQLNGDAPAGYAESVRFHIEETGTLQLTTVIAPGKAAVRVYTSGNKPLTQARAGGTLETPLVKGDVFVVLYALRGSGPIKLALISAFTPAPTGAAPAPPSNAATVLPDVGIEPEPGSNELPLDGL
jgi:hypothetical protein